MLPVRLGMDGLDAGVQQACRTWDMCDMLCAACLLVCRQVKYAADPKSSQGCHARCSNAHHNLAGLAAHAVHAMSLTLPTLPQQPGFHDTRDGGQLCVP